MATFDDARITEILKGRRAVRRVPFPGPGVDDGVEIGVRLLADQEIDDARLEAQRYIERRCRLVKLDYTKVIEADEEALQRACEQEIVFRAFVDPDTDPPRPFFSTLAQVRSLDSVTLRSLIDVYLDHQEVVLPGVTLSDEDVEKLVDALGKGQEPQGVLAHFAPSTLRLFVRSMAVRLHATSPTGKSTTSSSSSAT